MDKIRVLLADDHGIVRNGIKSLFNDVDEIEIVGECADGEETIEKIKELSPDVLITDIEMPKLSGIEVTEIVRKDFPKTNILILSMHDDEEYVVKAIEAGAIGYLSKDIEEEDIVAAVKYVARGEMYYTNAISEIMARSLFKKSKKSIDNRNESLTSREIEILKLIVEGLSNKLIAYKLYISLRTVDTHRTNIMRKLQTKNTAELVRLAIVNKLVE